MQDYRRWRFQTPMDRGCSKTGLPIRWINQDAPKLDGMRIRFAASVDDEEADRRARLIAGAPAMQNALGRIIALCTEGKSPDRVELREIALQALVHGGGAPVEGAP